MELIFIFFIIMCVLGFLFVLETIFLIVVLKVTPAGTFLLAKMKRMPIIALRYKDFTARFICPKRRLGNFVEVKKLGYYELVKGTGNFDVNSKVVWYDCLTEQTASQGLYKAALIKELKEIGYDINAWADLKYIMKCAGDKTWIMGEYRRLKKVSEKMAEKFKMLVKNIRRGSVDLFTAKSYKLTELYNLFPNDYSPADTNEAVTLAVQLDRKKRNTDIMIYAMAILIIGIGAGLAYVLFTSNSTPEVTVKVTTDMLRNASGLVG